MDVYTLGHLTPIEILLLFCVPGFFCVFTPVPHAKCVLESLAFFRNVFKGGAEKTRSEAGCAFTEEKVRYRAGALRVTGSATRSTE
uniref:Uncharacterized protein n=1 Tax=Anguilla anguilla TaxID=7936 RepID=A0A0E9SN10_ANGAN